MGLMGIIMKFLLKVLCIRMIVHLFRKRIFINKIEKKPKSCLRIKSIKRRSKYIKILLIYSQGYPKKYINQKNYKN